MNDNSLTQAAPVSSRPADSVKIWRRRRISTAFFALTLLATSSALLAATAPSKFECRYEHRDAYKAHAAQCELLEDKTARRSCIREAREEYRSAKRICGDN